MLRTVEELGARIGRVVDEKQAAYGDIRKSLGLTLHLFEGCKRGKVYVLTKEQLENLIFLQHMSEKMCRFSTHAQDPMGEDAVNDLIGYGLLLKKVREDAEELHRSGLA